MDRVDQSKVSFTDPTSSDRMFSAVAGNTRVLRSAAVLLLVLIASVACATGIPAPLERSEAPESTGKDTKPQLASYEAVTVPDEISGFDSDEVERRLGRLLGEGNSAGSTPFAAQGAEPTLADTEPTLQEILDLLNTEAASGGKGEVVISISPETISGLADPVLTIKTPPQYGTATIISPTQILYVPDRETEGGDAFEYELFDGTESVISLMVEFVH